MNQRESLCRLLLALFSNESLRRFVRYGPGGGEIEQHLPSERSSQRALVDTTVALLEEHGVIDDAFWRRLVAERPRRQREIEAVQALWRTPASAADTSGLRILFLSSSPHTLGPVAVAREYRLLARRLAASKYRDQVTLIHCPDLHTGDLPTQLRRVAPHVIHFSGHGRPDGRIWMHKRDGSVHAIAAEVLSGFFCNRKRAVRLVTLNACYSDALARMLVKQIDCVVSTSKSIPDAASIVFAETFYEALWDGESVLDAFCDGVHAITAEALTGADALQLMTRPGVSADQVMLTRRTQ